MARLPDAWFDLSVTMPKISSSNNLGRDRRHLLSIAKKQEALGRFGPQVDVPSCPRISTHHSWWCSGHPVTAAAENTILSPYHRNSHHPHYRPTAMPSARGSEPPARMPVSGSRAITCTEPPAPHIPARSIG